jgi:hypothetical protein
MRNPVEIEDIEELRRREGIEDVQLRIEIRELRVGDFVRLTVITGTTSFATLTVRITSMKDSAFRGKVAKKPASSGLRKLPVGAPLVFTAAHIHSVIKKQAAHGQ